MNGVQTFLGGLNGTLFGALTFCLGYLLGHWLALGRDKRKEFNTLTEPAFLALTKAVERAKQGWEAPRFGMEWVLVECYFWPLKRRRFRACVERYRTAQSCFGEYDPVTGDRTADLTKLPHVTRCTADLLGYLRRR